MISVHKIPRGRPRKQESARAADRQAMIAAALELLREGGSSALTARALAERVGTAIGSVYSAFESLEVLKLEANAVTMRRLRDHLAGALAASAAHGVADRLLVLADAYRAFARDNHNVWAAIFDPRVTEAPPAIAADNAALIAQIEKVIGAIPGLGREAVPVLAKALWSSVHGMVYLGEIGSLGPVERDDVPAMIETLVRAAVKGLCHPST